MSDHTPLPALNLDIQPSDALDEHCTDLGNARRLVRLVGQDLRYARPWRQWLVWTGARWEPDQTGTVERLSKQVVSALHIDAYAEPDPTRRKQLAKHALESESARAIRAMIELARTEYKVAIPPRALDRDPWLFNVQNGTIDLRTGRLREHRREDLITKLVPVAYDPAATCPTFEAFLFRIFGGNEALIGFVQRAAGYALTGDTREQCFFLLYGCGANGKSTLVGALMGLLDSYAGQVAADTLLARKDDSVLALNDLATLEGKRLVAAVESDMGRRLAESLVKQLTGGDRLKVKRLYQDVYETQPSFKIWLSTNHRPTIRGTDWAIWRRIRPIPFEVTIPEAEQDRTLSAKLEAERPGILAWALKGCLDWQQKGLAAPEEVRRATDTYRAEEDVIGRFVEEHCVVAAGETVATAELYGRYTAWAKSAGEPAVTQKAFGQALTERGFLKGRDGARTKRTRIGLRLKGQESA